MWTLIVFAVGYLVGHGAFPVVNAVAQGKTPPK